jgi:hypothetical protein
MHVFLSLSYSLLSCQFSFTFLSLSLKFWSYIAIILRLVGLGLQIDQIVIQMSHLFCNNVVILWSQLWFIVTVCHVHVTSAVLVMSVLGQVSLLIPCMSRMYCTIFLSSSSVSHSLVYHSNFVVILSSHCVLWGSADTELRLSSCITFIM